MCGYYKQISNTEPTTKISNIDTDLKCRHRHNSFSTKFVFRQTFLVRLIVDWDIQKLSCGRLLLRHSVVYLYRILMQTIWNIFICSSICYLWCTCSSVKRHLWHNTYRTFCFLGAHHRRRRGAQKLVALAVSHNELWSQCHQPWLRRYSSSLLVR